MRLMLILTLFASLWLSACSETGDDLSAYKGKTAQQIFSQAKHNIVKANYDSATHDLTALDTMYPFGPYARPGQLAMIYADYMNGDAEMTVASADRYLQLYPRGPDADYALYMRGLASFNMSGTWAQRKLNFDMSQRDLHNFNDAYGAFARLLRWFPKSIYIPNAALRMAYVRNLMAKHNLLLADYYWNRNSYIAAFNRASVVVKNFQGAPQVEPALAMMVKCDLKLGLLTEAKKAYNVLAVSYPDYADLKKLRQQVVG